MAVNASSISVQAPRRRVPGWVWFFAVIGLAALVLAWLGPMLAVRKPVEALPNMVVGQSPDGKYQIVTRYGVAVGGGCRTQNMLQEFTGSKRGWRTMQLGRPGTFAGPKGGNLPCPKASLLEALDEFFGKLSNGEKNLARPAYEEAIKNILKLPPNMVP